MENTRDGAGEGECAGELSLPQRCLADRSLLGYILRTWEMLSIHHPTGSSHNPEDLLLGTQSRGHFSRQPVKYSRGGVRPVTHQLSSLALVAYKLCEETPVTVSTVHGGSLRGRSLGPASASSEGSPLRRNPLPKHFEITQETARLLSKLDSETVSRATSCADTEPEESEEHL